MFQKNYVLLKLFRNEPLVEPLEHQHHHGPQLSEIEWKELFEEVGFYVETQSYEEAIAMKAKK